jgi:hypothetical protein
LHCGRQALQTVHHACLLASVHSQPGASEQKRSSSRSSSEQCKQSEQYKRTLISLDCKAAATAIHWCRRQVYTHTPLQTTSLKDIYSAVLLLLHTNQPPTEYARKTNCSGSGDAPDRMTRVSLTHLSAALYSVAKDESAHDTTASV